MVSIFKFNCFSCTFIQRWQKNVTTIRNYAMRKRFYRKTGIVQNGNNWEVTLDHRRLKTPNGKVLTVNSEILAYAIAAEWDSQDSFIAQPTMHLTALCNTALDNPGKLNKHDITSYLLEFMPTDTLLFYSDDESGLRDIQKERWSPIIQWFNTKFEVDQKVALDLQPPPVSAQTRGVLAKYFLSFDLPSLSAICFGVEALKSPILMLACLEKHVEPKEAVTLARLEEEYQASVWGRVPWAHEMSQAELTARVAAALLFIHCSCELHTKKTKAGHTDPDQSSP